MPLTRLKDEYLEQEDDVRFLMADELGNTVACKVSHEALRANVPSVNPLPEPTVLFSKHIGSLSKNWRGRPLMLRDLSTIMAAFWSPQRRSQGSVGAPRQMSTS
jgi:hypothetical protein